MTIMDFVVTAIACIAVAVVSIVVNRFFAFSVGKQNKNKRIS